MKMSLIALSLLFAQASLAEIKDSQYEVRHQNLLETEILKNCGQMRDLNQISSIQQVIQIDNGIQDIKFKTVLSGLLRLDQNIFDKYIITVHSEYSDMYDHSSGEWGVYSLNDISCVME